MLKSITLSLVIIFWITIANGQKHFQVTFKIDNSIPIDQVKYQYDDGKIINFFSADKNRQIVLKGTYFSTYASFNVSFVTKDTLYYSSDFLLSAKNASMVFYHRSNLSQILRYKNVKNAIPIYDTVTNKTYRELSNFTKAAGIDLYNFSQKNKAQLGSSDSLKKIYFQKLKLIDTRSMTFLRKYPNNYFSFWYFLHNIVQNNTFLGSDPAYFKQQFDYFNSTFPKKFTQSFEGEKFVEKYERAIHSLKANDTAPTFTIKTIDGKSISLNNLKGKYVLLDFWATWCVPCMKEMTFIKDIRKNYSPDKLALIGISQDRDLTVVKKVISQQSMNWDHFFDNKTDISTLYGVNEFPTLILINDQGKIVYRSDNLKDDNVELPKLLAVLK